MSSYCRHRLIPYHVGRVITVKIVGHIETSAHIQSPGVGFDGRMIEHVMMASPETNVRIEATFQRSVLAGVGSQVPLAVNVVLVAENR